MVFAGSSPGGLSIFALISVKALPPEATAEQPQPQPVASGSVPFNGAIDITLFTAPIVVLGIFVMIRREYFFK
jgi:hypothetical protein